MKILRSGLKIIFVLLFATILFEETAFAAPLTPQKVIELTNKTRSEYGLPPLYISTKLMEAAQKKATDLVARHYWSHTTPDGKPFWYFADVVNYKWAYLGENLAMNFKTEEAAFSAWLKSTSHRKNILNPIYEDIGVGIDGNVIAVLYGTENRNFIKRTLSIIAPFLTSLYSLFSKS